VLTVGDELWGFTSEASRRLWDELVPPPTRKAAWRLVVTYAGFSNESNLLEELYEHGLKQPQIGPDLYAGEGQLTFWTHKPVAPWQTQGWLDQMKRSLRPNQYLRLIENRWTSSQSAFIDMAEWDACVIDGLQPTERDQNLSVFVAVDASLKRDSTAIVAVASDGERVSLVTHRIFQPSPDEPLDFEATIEATLIELCARFSVQAIRYDPWQMAAVAQRMIKRGVPMEEFPQTTSNLTDSSSNLFELIKSGSLQVYADDAMRTSISQAVAVETPRGWRIAKEKAKHKIDVVVALGMACHAAVKQEMLPGAGMLEWYRRKSEAEKAGQSPPTVAQALASEGIGQVGTKPSPPAGHVLVRIPTGASNITISRGGNYQTQVVDGETVCLMTIADARELLSPLNPTFTEANPELAARLSVKVKPAEVRVTDWLAAHDAARPRHPDDRGGLVMDSLRAVGRWP
jgi:Phage Terminase